MNNDDHEIHFLFVKFAPWWRSHFETIKSCIFFLTPECRNCLQAACHLFFPPGCSFCIQAWRQNLPSGHPEKFALWPEGKICLLARLGANFALLEDAIFALLLSAEFARDSYHYLINDSLRKKYRRLAKRIIACEPFPPRGRWQPPPGRHARAG